MTLKNIGLQAKCLRNETSEILFLFKSLIKENCKSEMAEMLTGSSFQDMARGQNMKFMLNSFPSNIQHVMCHLVLSILEAPKGCNRIQSGYTED